MTSVFFRAVVEQGRRLNLLSDEHFTVDGTLVEVWASLKSFKSKDGGPGEQLDDPSNQTVNFRGERRTNATHQSTTDPEARLARKGPGKEARLCYSANALMENRNTILIDLQVEPADGYAKRSAAIAMVDGNLPGSRRITLAGDRGYDTRDFVEVAARLPSPRTWPRIRRARVARRLTHAPCAIRATRSVSGSASGSKRSSAG